MWFFLITLFYLIPSMILYLITVYVIIKHWKKFKSSFFVWYLLDFLMNTLTTGITFYTLKLSSVTCQTCALSSIYLMLENNFTLNIMYSLMYNMSYVQYAITSIISINRLSIIWNHFLFERLWIKYSFILIFAINLLPFINTSQLFYSTCQFGNRSDDTFVLRCDLVSLFWKSFKHEWNHHLQPTNLLFTPLIYFQGVCTLCSLICNIKSCSIVWKASIEMKANMGKLVIFFS